jgi:MFS family permease
MIGSLLAQDARSLRRTLGGTSGILVVVVLVSLTGVLLDVPFVGGVALVIAIIAAVAFTPIVLGILAENYWRTMYGREGYFTMALFGLIATFAAAVATALLLLACAVAFALSLDRSPADVIRGALAQLPDGMGAFLAVAVSLQLIYLVVVGAALMSIGASARFNHLGFGAPVIGGVLTYVAMTAASFLAMMLVPLGITMTGPDAGSLVVQTMLPTFIAEVTGGATDGPQVVGIGMLFTSVAASVVFAVWGARTVDRRTSLR